MICCEHCETAMFLEITSSEIVFLDDELQRLTETYACRECGLEGTYEYDDGTEETDGGIVATAERPRTIATDGGETQ